MNEFERQKQQAAEELRQMQEQSRMPKIPDFVRLNRPGSEEAGPKPPPGPKPSPGGVPSAKPPGEKSDADRLLLIGIFLLLFSQKQDDLLLYALLYIML